MDYPGLKKRLRRDYSAGRKRVALKGMTLDWACLLSAWGATE
jgi:hypothetical protein